MIGRKIELQLMLERFKCEPDKTATNVVILNLGVGFAEVSDLAPESRRAYKTTSRIGTADKI